MTLSAAFRFAYMLPVRLIWIRRLMTDPKLSQTYYPQEPRKSKFKVLVELLWFLLRHQEVNYEYYYYGFDRLEGVDPEEYLTKEEKTLDFAIGFVSFFAFNWAIYYFLPYMGIILATIIGYGLGGTGESMEQVSICATFILPCAINIGLLLFCAYPRFHLINSIHNSHL